VTRVLGHTFGHTFGRSFGRTLGCVVAAIYALHGDARADVRWADGVSKDSQQKANALFAEANQLFAQQAHAPALDKYRAAIALWDHPLIEFNMAVTLVRLDRILEAADALDKALRFDQAPFPTTEQYQQAIDYQRLVAGRVGTISVTCQQQGATMLLDGKPWFTCPGTQTVRVLAGEHVVVGEAKGFMTVSRRTVVTGASSIAGTYTFLPLDEVGTLEYPSPRWLPWTVTASGAVLALGGAAFWVAGNTQMERFRTDYEDLCRDSCDEDLDTNATERQLAAQRDGAYLKNHVGIAMLSVGGAIVVGGAVWTIFNRPRRVVPTLEVSPSSGAMRASLGWQF
jgi:hypothetical protein